MQHSFEKDLIALSRDWEQVGIILSAAMQEVAVEFGGDELAKKVAEATQPWEVLPNPAALQLLENMHPGSAALVMTRTTEIQHRTHESELANLNKRNIRKFGRSLLNGFGSLAGFANR